MLAGDAGGGIVVVVIGRIPASAVLHKVGDGGRLPLGVGTGAGGKVQL